MAAIIVVSIIIVVIIIIIIRARKVAWDKRADGWTDRIRETCAVTTPMEQKKPGKIKHIRAFWLTELKMHQLQQPQHLWAFLHQLLPTLETAETYYLHQWLSLTARQGPNQRL